MKLFAKMGGTMVDNRQLLVVSSALSFVVCYFNYETYEMGIFKYYECFHALIAAGFDSSAHTCDSSTFPMWGYGWLLLLSQSKPVLLFIHCSLSIGSVLFLLTTVRTAFSLTNFQYNLLKWLVVLSLPWYALNSVLWPHTIAVSLLLISLALLIRAHCSATAEFRLWLLSGLSFGIMLNFRSDFILLPIGLMLILLLFGHDSILVRIRRILAWCAPMFLVMVPWGIYTNETTGHYLQTSTNGGHVLYIGLGQLPGNSWGITPRDEDPSMAALLEQEFGEPVSSLTYEADVVLKARFRELVFASPGEYARKVLHNIRLLLFGGAYAGAFHEQTACQPDCLNKYVNLGQSISSQGQVARGLLTGRLNINPGLAFTDYLRLTLLSVSVLQSLLVMFFGILFSVFLLPYSLREKNVPMLLLLAVVGYQLALSSFTFFMRTYSSSIYVLMLVVMVMGPSLLLRELSAAFPKFRLFAASGRAKKEIQ
jgi:hypothetical protein